MKISHELRAMGMRDKSDEFAARGGKVYIDLESAPDPVSQGL
jgi:phosphomethylpyrimidine synthase